MALKAAIFDLDGTLIDSEPFSHSLYKALLEPYGHTLPEQRYALEYSGHTLDINLVHLIDQYDLPITVEDGFRFFEEHGANKGQAGVPLKPGVARLLAWLTSHNIAMALGSSSGEERAFGYLDPLGVGHYFPVAAYGPEVEHGKPAPDIFLLAAERLGATPDECVVFEDSEAGVLAGVAAGMRTFCTPDMAPVSEEARAQAYANLTRIDQAIPLLEELLD